MKNNKYTLTGCPMLTTPYTYKRTVGLWRPIWSQWFLVFEALVTFCHFPPQQLVKPLGDFPWSPCCGS